MRRADLRRCRNATYVLVVCAVCAQARGQATRVNARVDTRFDFSELESFHWHPEQRIEAELDQHLKIIVAVQRRLSALGYRLDAREPDVHVRYRFSISETEVPKSQEDPEVFECSDADCEEEAWAYLFFGLLAAAIKDDDRTIEHLHLTLVVVDAATNWEIYHAKGTFPWSEDESDWIVRQAVRDLLEKLPPPGGRP